MAEKVAPQACGRSLSGDEYEDAWFYIEMNYFHYVEMLIKMLAQIRRCVQGAKYKQLWQNEALN